MSAAKHTPGPWVATPNLTAVVADGGEAGNRMITSTLGKRFEQQANTRLIAAAPDLLAALQRIHGQALHGDYVTSAFVIDWARSAIARATGETK